MIWIYYYTVLFGMILLNVCFTIQSMEPPIKKRKVINVINSQAVFNDALYKITIDDSIKELKKAKLVIDSLFKCTDVPKVNEPVSSYYGKMLPLQILAFYTKTCVKQRNKSREAVATTLITTLIEHGADPYLYDPDNPLNQNFVEIFEMDKYQSKILQKIKYQAIETYKKFNKAKISVATLLNPDKSNPQN